MAYRVSEWALKNLIYSPLGTSHIPIFLSADADAKKSPFSENITMIT